MIAIEENELSQRGQTTDRQPLLLPSDLGAGAPALPPAELVADVMTVIRVNLLVEVASPDDDLLETGVLDSLTLMQLVVHLEERFGLRLSLAELEIDDLRSVNTITRWCHAAMKSRGWIPAERTS